MKNKGKLVQLLSFVAATIGIVCIACFFFPFISISREDNLGYYSGLEVGMGYSDNIVRMGMNILLIVSALFILIAVSLIFFKYNNKLANVISGIMFFVSALLIFLLPVYAKSLGNMVIGSTYEIGLAWGSIACGIVALLGAALCVAILILNKKIDNEGQLNFSETKQSNEEVVVEETTENK